MKKVIFLFIYFFIFSTLLFAQRWSYVEDFLTTEDKFSARPHGVVVTPDDKIWVGFYGFSDRLDNAEGDSISPLWIYNPDGSLFKKLEFLTYNGITDTIFNFCRGLSLDKDGNVLFTEWDKLWRINYQTYEAINKVIPLLDVPLTEAASDTNGYIYLTHVIPDGRPFYIYDKNFVLFDYVDVSVTTLQRSIVVSPDGKDVYVGKIYGGDEGNGIIHYHSDSGPGGHYAKIDTFQTNIWGQCLDWDNNGLLWVGSYWDVGDNDLTGWYALDPSQNWEIVGSIGRNFGHYNENIPFPLDGTYYSPRGASWNADGSKMYTADFDGLSIKKWYNPNTLIQNESTSPQKKSFALQQNFPNPFNPVTSIEFQIKAAGKVELAIYNSIGQKIRTLVDEHRQPGNYTATWNGCDENGTKVTSGIYFYKIQTNEFSSIRKMTLMK